MPWMLFAADKFVGCLAEFTLGKEVTLAGTP